MSTKRQARGPAAPEPARRPGRVTVAPEPSQGSWMPLVFSGIAAIVVIGLLASMMLSPSKGTGAGNAGGATNPAAGKQEALAIGSLAPDFTLTSLDGTQVQLSSFRGKNPVWVNFWATWCTFCKQEMPEMKALYNSEYKAKGLVILGVDDHESQPEVAQYVQIGGYNWTFLLDGDGQVDLKYRVTGLPTHIFIGKDGVIQDMVVGGIQQTRMVSELTRLFAP